MRVTSILSSALLILCELDIISAKAIIYAPSRMTRKSSQDDGLRKAAIKVVEDKIARREPQTSSSLTPSTLNSDNNATIASACTTALSKLSEVSNEAGITACYNILQYDPALGAFQADLRLYQSTAPSGDFSHIQINELMVSLVYPHSTSFRSLMKRSKRDLTQRQVPLSEIQQYSLIGSFQKSMDMLKLNQTQLMSLMVPTISINAVESTAQTPLTTNLTTTDVAYFVVGEFEDDFSATAVSPTNQAVAIAQASAFVLPGTTLGMFPTGLIVTSTWMLLFIIAYGVGTFGRIRHRNIYRRRKAASAGRTGKRI